MSALHSLSHQSHAGVWTEHGLCIRSATHGHRSGCQALPLGRPKPKLYVGGRFAGAPGVGGAKLPLRTRCLATLLPGKKNLYLLCPAGVSRTRGTSGSPFLPDPFPELCAPRLSGIGAEEGYFGGPLRQAAEAVGWAGGPAARADAGQQVGAPPRAPRPPHRQARGRQLPLSPVNAVTCDSERRVPNVPARCVIDSSLRLRLPFQLRLQERPLLADPLSGQAFFVGACVPSEL